MRAAVVRAPGEVAIEELDMPSPRQGEVRLRMVATGVCRTDLSIFQGHLPVPMPIVLGHEGAGIVEEVGPGVRDLSVGDAVVCSIIAGCGSCFQCLRESSALCENVVFYTGKMFDDTTRLSKGGAPEAGGEAIHSLSYQASFAEQAIVPERCAVRVREDAALDEVAGLACGVATGLGAATVRSPVEPGDRVVVIGVGGVGLSVAMGARLRGAGEVIGVDVLPGKLEHARELGLVSQTIDASDAGPDGKGVVEQVLALTGGRGADAVFDCVGSAATMLQALDATRPGGHVVLIGIASAGVEVPVEARHLFRQKTVTGTMGGSIEPRRHIPEFVDLHQAGRIDLAMMMDRTYALDEIATAFDDLEAGRITRGVIRF